MTGAAELWAKGDYRQIARELEPVAQRLVELAGVGTGARVLDVAAGDGNVAVEAARRGAEVTALEVAPRLVAAGRERTAGLAVDWVEADAAALPFPDGSFDAVLSTFGSVYLPDPSAAAEEHARVATRGGTIGLASWTPEGFQGVAAAALAEALGREGAYQPASWGDPETARSRLAPHVGTVEFERGTVARSFESTEAWLVFAEQVAPPLIAVREAVEPGLYKRIRKRLLEVADRFSRPADEGIALEQEYLLIVGRAAR